MIKEAYLAKIYGFVVISLIIVSGFFLVSCRENGDLPEDAKWIANHDRVHFAYADISYLRREMALREIGRIICTERFSHSDYCQVYFWSNEKEVITELPVIQRGSLFAMFEMKGEQFKLKRFKERL